MAVLVKSLEDRVCIPGDGFPMIKDAAPVSTYRVTTQSNVSTDSEDGEIGNIDTRTSSRIITHSSIQGEPSFVLGELPSAVQREPQSNADQNPTV